MNKRIAQVRKYTGLNQLQFAERIGLTKNFVSLLETGNRTPSDRTISDICREFGISEDWLRTGNGNMEKPMSRDQEIATFMGDVMAGETDDFRRRLMAVLAKLDVSEWELLEKMALKLAAESKKEDQAEA